MLKKLYKKYSLSVSVYLMSLIFQSIDWVARDVGVEYNNENFQDSDGKYYNNLSETLEIPKYIIKIFGKTEDGDSIAVNALSYTPHFYIKVPNKLTDNELDNFRKFVESKIPLRFCINKEKDIYHYVKKSLHDVVQFKRKDLWGFTNEEKFDFIRLSFFNECTMKFMARLFKKTVIIPGVFRKSVKLAIYESNIEPYLRFIHKQNISPSGWIEIDNDHLKPNTDILPVKRGKDYNVKWTNIKGIERTDMAPFLVASFDIECNSSHGDFPVPIKDYEKVAMEFNTIYQKIKADKNELELKKILCNALLSGFDTELETEYKISKIYTKKEPDIDKMRVILENGLMDDLLIILKGELQFDKDFLNDMNKYLQRKASICEEEEEEDEKEKFKNIFKPRKEFKNSITIIIKQLIDKFHALKQIFPLLEGDQVIQIGTTFHRYGEKEVCYRNIITLDTCDEIPGVDVISVDSESKLIKEWVKLINKHNPDVITGYNIFGFDFEFLYKRSLELNIRKQFLKINKIKNNISDWVVQNLSSSALGDNELKYVKMEGRVLIDMMKVVQRDHKLDSYRLDYVSGEFISGKVKKIETSNDMIYCYLDNCNGIQKDSFITLDGNDKTKVLDIIPDENKVLIKATSDELVAKKWGLAKDDVSPAEIFECQRGNSSDRARVAKYCVMDCALCNYLMIKLETIANNIGMSNVCSVPLSYIFMRGQSIKIFSFVAKQCKEDNFLIPVLDKDWNCNICGIKNSSYIDSCTSCNSSKPDDDGYEGAIVLTPKPGIYTEDPIVVLDYASLYPSSMISENISHDSIVLDPKYDNLPGYEYIDITFDIFEGKGDKKKKTGEQTCRYAQFPNNQKGILPRILQKLLQQRKNTRKKIKEVKITLNNDKVIQGLIIEKNEDTIKLIDSTKSEIIINKNEIIKQEDAFNDFEKAVLDGLQLAYKITANSLYGQVGAKTSPIFLKELAASTTATGRNLILGAKKFAEDNFGAQVIYGDSVPFDEPIVIRNPKTNLVDVKAISDISQEWQSYEDFKNSDYTITLRNVLSKILIDGVDSEEECIEMTKSIPKWLRKKTIDNKELIFIDNKWKWFNEIDDPIEQIKNINILFEKDTTNRFDKQQALVDYEVWTDNGWQKILRIIRHKTEKKIHRISTGLGVVDVTEDHSLCDINKKPIKPNEVIIGETELLHSDFSKIDFDAMENNIPLVLEYPHPYWGETAEKYVDNSGELYKCSTCHKEYEGSMFYWTIPYKQKKKGSTEKKRGNQCKLCRKQKQCSTKGIEFNGKLNKEVLDIRKMSYQLTSDEAWVWGFFLGDGSCGKYECKSGLKYSWALNNQDIERLTHAKSILEKIEGLEFKRLETMKSSGVYKLVPTGSLRYMVQKYRKLMYDDLKQKKVPELILNAPYSIRKAFFDGYYEADGTKSTKSNNGKELYSTDKNWNNIYNKIEITTKNKSTAQQLYLLGTSLGYKLKVLSRNDKLDIYRLGTYSRDNRTFITQNNIIDKIEIEDNKYVYDIETVTGRFNSGVGNISLLQTDSLFISFNIKNKYGLTDKTEILRKAIELGEAVSDGFQKLLKPPHVLEYEKSLFPFIIFSKKRYVGNLYENDPEKYYRKVMGLSLKRRDSAQISKIVYGGLIDIILKTNDINESLKYFHTCIRDILDEKYPLEDFIITKTLKGQYKIPDKIVHKVLADRMALRDKGSAPQINDRVPFVYINKKEKRGEKLLQGDKVEDPDYIRKNKLHIDYEFYITNQIMKPIQQLYSLIIEKLPGFKLGENYFDNIEKNLKMDDKNDSKKIETKLTTLKEKEVKKILFDPYLNKLYIKKNNMKDITDFLQLCK